jgi:sugar fermentation stimulation protein A
VKFGAPLQRGTLRRRYKRFLADIALEHGGEVTAHVANPGAMTGLAEPGMEVWLSHSPDRGRKLPWSWELVQTEDSLVVVDTLLPNKVAAEALAMGRVTELAGYAEIRREVAYGRGSRVDFLLSAPGRPDCYVEVKSVTLREGAAACFPDSVTARGSRHLAELAERVGLGERAVTLYLVQREDCAHFRIADWIDAEYGRSWRRATAEGVETLCYACHISRDGIEIANRMGIFEGAGRGYGTGRVEPQQV